MAHIISMLLCMALIGLCPRPARAEGSDLLGPGLSLALTESAPADSEPTKAPESLATETETSPETKPSFWRDKFQFSGTLRQETAFRVVNSDQFDRNFSKIKQYVDMSFKFLFNETINLKISGRAWYDAVYDATNQYPADVNDQMKKELLLRDFYVDIFGPKIQARLGHQQIVWGESLIQSFADVVNPFDYREFFLPPSDYTRLQIWAVDLRYFFLPDAMLELVASPDQTVDKLALPGADYSFFPEIGETFTVNPVIPGVGTTLLSQKVPPLSIANWNGGARFTFLTHGWDFSWLFYTTTSHLPAVFKTLAINLETGEPTLLLNLIHNRVYDFGFTFSKEVKANILRGEMVYTQNRYFNAKDVLFNQGVVKGGTFRYVLGFDTTLAGRVDMVSEFQQQVIVGDTNEISDPIVDSWLSLHFETGFLNETVLPELTFTVGLRKGDTMIRPRINFLITDAIQLSWGADIFTGPEDTLFGQFDDTTRIYMDTQWTF